jgi:hypothetical protein
MNRLSAVFAVLSPEKIPPLNMGARLSIMNNDFYPLLNNSDAVLLAEAVELMRVNLGKMFPLVQTMKKCRIEQRELLLACNYINSYIHIIDETLALEKNARVANYAYSRKAG